MPRRARLILDPPAAGMIIERRRHKRRPEVRGDPAHRRSQRHGLEVELGPDDAPLAELSMNVVANHLRQDWSKAQATDVRARRMTTAAFRYALITRALFVFAGFVHAHCNVR